MSNKIDNRVSRSQVGNFTQYNKFMTDVCSALMNNNNIAKLILDTSEDPFGKKNITPEERKWLLRNRIMPVPLIENIAGVEGVWLVVQINQIQPSDNPKFKNFVLHIDVICHTNLWMIKQGLRPYYLMEEVDKILNQNKDIGISTINFAGASMNNLNAELIEYVMSYHVIEYSY